MADEDLQENKLFKLFLSSPLYDEAASKKYLVCVPTAGSLAVAKLDEAFLRAHVLQLSPYFRNEYVTLSGKGVVIKGKSIVANTSSVPRRINVICDELYYDDDYESFEVVRVDLPLVGPVSKEYMEGLALTATTSGAAIERRTVVDHKNAIVTLLGGTEGKSVLEKVTTFADRFNSSYVMVQGLFGHTGAKIRESCNLIRTEAVSHVRSGSLTPVQCGELQLAIEAVTLSQVNAKVFAGLCQLYTDKEAEFAAQADAVRGMSLQELGLPEEMWSVKPSSAIGIMASLNKSATVIERLCKLHDVSRQLSNAVDEDNKRRAKEQQSGFISFFSSKPVEVKNTVLTSDEMVPLTVYVLAQSQVKHVLANLEYLTHFLPADKAREGEKDFVPVDLSRLKVHFANFSAAIQFIQERQSSTSSSSSSRSHVSPMTQGMTIAPSSRGRTKATLPVRVPHSEPQSMRRLTGDPQQQQQQQHQHQQSPLSSTPTSTNPFGPSASTNPFGPPSPTMRKAYSSQGPSNNSGSGSAHLRTHSSTNPFDDVHDGGVSRRISSRRRNKKYATVNFSNLSLTQPQPNATRRLNDSNNNYNSSSRPSYSSGGVHQRQPAPRMSSRGSVAVPGRGSVQARGNAYSSYSPANQQRRNSGPTLVSLEDSNDAQSENDLGDFLSKLRNTSDDVSGNIRGF